MINNTSLQRWKRLEAKRLDAVFLHEIIAGLNCSRFEAEAVLQKVHQTYELLFEGGDTLRPGQLTLSVLSVEASASAKLAEAPQRIVRLTLDDPEEDLRVRQEQGVVGVRRQRMIRMCTEALQQGGVLTVEDLSIRLFNCGVRTICRDLEELRAEGIEVPLRSVVKDMGRTLSHRRQIVEAWLQGQEYSQIARSCHHSVSSVQNYVEKFRRIAVLRAESLEVATIAFLVGISIPLCEEYLKLLSTADGASHRLKQINTQHYQKKVSELTKGACGD